MSSQTKLVLQNELLQNGISVPDEYLEHFYQAFKKEEIKNSFRGLSWVDFMRKELKGYSFSF